MEGLNKTPDEIKKGLECCNTGKIPACELCSYKSFELGPHGVHYVNYHCKQLQIDALAYIQQIEADNARLTRCIENMTDKLNAAHDETVELKRERDALLEGLERADLGCEYCKHCNSSIELDADKCPCNKCRNNSHWEWAGIKEATP